MCQKPSRLLLLLTGTGLALSAAPAAAVEIYKWVDEDGSTHYSESLPTGEFAGLEILEARPSVPRSPAAANDYQSTLEVAASLQADRLERERVRLEKDKLRQQERRAREEVQRLNNAYAAPSYLVPYYRYPYRPYPHPRPPYAVQPPPGHYPAPTVPKRVYIGR